MYVRFLYYTRFPYSTISVIVNMVLSCINKKYSLLFSIWYRRRLILIIIQTLALNLSLIRFISIPRTQIYRIIAMNHKPFSDLSLISYPLFNSGSQNHKKPPQIILVSKLLNPYKIHLSLTHTIKSQFTNPFLLFPLIKPRLITNSPINFSYRQSCCHQSQIKLHLNPTGPLHTLPSNHHLHLKTKPQNYWSSTHSSLNPDPQSVAKSGFWLNGSEI